MATERSVSRSLCKSNWLRLQRENNSALFRWRRRHVEELESRRLLTVVANVGDADHQIWNLPATADQVEIRATSSNSFVIDSVNNTFDEVFFSFSGTSVTINAGDGADMLRFSNLLATNLDNRLTIVGGGGSDTLLGPVGDTDWSITGSGAGHVARVAFTGIENLTGAPDNQDTFVFDAGGSLSGVLDGGAGGFDVIKLSGGAFQNVAYTSSGLTSGSIARDGNIITYTDVEPIIDSTVGGTRTFDATAGADRISLRDRGTNLDDAFAVSIDTAEDVIFTDASAITSLVVNALGGDDKIDVDTLDSGFIGDLTINAGAGNDDITVLKISGPGQYTIAGDGDTNSFHFDAGGAITLTDAALNTLDLSNIQRAFVSGSTLNAAGFSGQVFFTSTQSLWTEQGPQPYTQILDGATVPWDPVAGAIQTIAVDPNDR
ncbi:MAG TPA: hypothetical protein VL175_03480, partial [Pirellulales bacterium]|nr:hypothetical protein [Pirellulales bacterium]